VAHTMNGVSSGHHGCTPAFGNAIKPPGSVINRCPPSCPITSFAHANHRPAGEVGEDVQITRPSQFGAIVAAR